MAYSIFGERYAKRIHDRTITLADVPPRRLQETKDSYMELYGVPLE